MSRMTLAWVSAAWIAGAAAAATAGRGAWPLAVAIAASMLAFALWKRERAAVALAVALPVVFVFAVVRYESLRSSAPPAGAVERYNDGAHVRIRAVVRDDPALSDTSQRFAVDVRELQRAGAWEDASGGVLVRAPLYPRYRAGEIVELEGALESPPQLDGFDYADYLVRRGISSVMEYPQARRIGRHEPGVVRNTLLRVRRRLSRALALSLPEPQASLAQGVLLGRRSALPADVRDDLNATNTSHLVVVSGSNIALASAYVMLLFGWLVGRRRALALSIAAVVAYAALVGLSPPVLRATIMGVLLIVAQLNGRPTSAVTSIMLAAAMMTGIEPSVVRDVSFQLSFAATAGIAYAAAPLRRWIIGALAAALRAHEVPRWTAPLFAEPLAVTLAALATTTPLLALHFGRVSLVAVPANMLVVPLFPFILAASLVASLGGLLPEGRLICAAPAQALLSYWLHVAAWLAAAPHASMSIDGYSWRWAAVTYCALVAVAVGLARFARLDGAARLAESRPLDAWHLARGATLAVPAVALATGLGLAVWPSEPRRLHVTVLDVGQGDAILIETPDGGDVLVDGGPGGAVLRALGAELSWLDRSIDIVVLSHPDGDHVAGLIDVLDRYDVHHVIVASDVNAGAMHDAFRDALRREGLEPQIARRGDRIDASGATIEVLWPDAAAAGASDNDASLVLRVGMGDVSFLLAADIEEPVERALVASGAELRATVLKVAHHGSATSSSRVFLDAVQPSVAVISAGHNNRFGHPSPDVVERLSEYGAVLTTAERGSVRIATDGHRIWVETGR